MVDRRFKGIYPSTLPRIAIMTPIQKHHHQSYDFDGIGATALRFRSKMKIMLHDTVLVLIGKKSHMWKVIFLREYSAQYLYSYTITTMYPFWKWHQNSALMALVQLQFGFQANRKSRLDVICKNTQKIIHLPNHSFEITYYDPYFIMVTKISRTCNGMPKGQFYPQLVQERGNYTNHFNGASPLIQILKQ